MAITSQPLQVSQAIVFPDGTMTYHFRDFMLQVNSAIAGSDATATWGGIGGTLADQTDLTTAIAAAVTYGNLSTNGDIGTGATQVAQGDHTHVEVDITDLDKYTQAQVDALLVYYAPTVRDEGTDPYTLVLADANKVLRFTTASAAVTIPVEASVAFPTGTEVSIRQAGTGTLALTTTSLTINGTVPSWAQHVEVKFRKVGADTWDVV